MKPFAISIHDKRRGANRLCFDLIDILRVDEELVRSLQWKCLCALCTGRSAKKLFDLSGQDQHSISGEKLLSLAAEVEKTIDCLFEGYRNDEKRFHVVIEGWTDDCFIVISRNRDFIEAVRVRFKKVREAPRYRNYPELPYKDQIIKLLDARLKQIRSGKAKTIPAEEVLARLRVRFPKQPKTKKSGRRAKERQLS